MNESGNNEHIVILICGFGRCGSSAIMQMFAAASVSVDGVPPWYETPLAKSGQWVSEQLGRAVKVLEPHRHAQKFPDAEYRCIWSDRDLKQQAASHVKFQTEKRGLIVVNPRGARKKTIQMMREQRAAGINLCESLGPTLITSFEDLTQHPYQTASEIAFHCDIHPYWIPFMGQQVARRTPQNRPNMELERALTPNQSLVN